jgi:MFS family permease
VIIQGGGMGRLVRSLRREARLVKMGFATMALSFALMAAVHQVSYLLVAIALLTFGSAILRPSLTALITTRAARHRQGMVIGLMQSLMSIAQIVAPVVAGFLIQANSSACGHWPAGLFCVIGWSLIAVTR